jgi:hypothetical protein
MNRWLLGIAGGSIVREISQQAIELNERRQVFTQARGYADAVGKPLLVIGSPKLRFNHPCGDVTIDISPEMAKFCNGLVADIRDIPYPNHYFGAAFASHVVEHLATIGDAMAAFDEMERVSDRVFIVSPHKSSVMAWINPNHHLWITPSGDGYIIEQRGKGQTGKENSYIISMQVL